MTPSRYQSRRATVSRAPGGESVPDWPGRSEHCRQAESGRTGILGRNGIITVAAKARRGGGPGGRLPGQPEAGASLVVVLSPGPAGRTSNLTQTRNPCLSLYSE